MKGTTFWQIAAVAAALGFTVPVLAEQGSAQAEKLFETLDRNADGKISSDEISDEQAKFFGRLVRVGDTNEDGELTKTEFLSALEDKPAPGGATFSAGLRPQQGDPRLLFQRLDKNKDGKISKSEIPEQLRQRLNPLFERLGKDEISLEDVKRLRERMADRMKNVAPGQLFERLDTDGDGKISLDEVPAPAKPRVRKMLEAAEKPQDDGLTKEEFVRAFARLRQAGEGRRPGFGPLFFRKLDANGDGKISKQELAQAADQFEELDANKDGGLDLRELMGGPLQGNRPGDSGKRRPQDKNASDADRRQPARRPDAKDLPALFKRLDRDGDGKISQQEAPRRMKERFDAIDSNGDGSVDVQELKSQLSKVRPRRRD